MPSLFLLAYVRAVVAKVALLDDAPTAACIRAGGGRMFCWNCSTEASAGSQAVPSFAGHGRMGGIHPSPITSPPCQIARCQHHCQHTLLSALQTTCHPRTASRNRNGMRRWPIGFPPWSLSARSIDFRAPSYPKLIRSRSTQWVSLVIY